MVKKITIIVLIIAVSGTIGYFGYSYLKSYNTKASPVIDAVPVNTCFFIESQNFRELIVSLNQGNDLWAGLRAIHTTDELSLDMLYLDSILGKNPEIENLIKQRSVIVSAHITGKEKFSFLFLAGIAKVTDADGAAGFIEKIVGNRAVLSSRIYDEVKIFDVKSASKDAFPNFSFTALNNIFIFSFSAILVEESIRQLNTKSSLVHEKEFLKVQNTAGKNVDANIFINYKNFPKLLSFFLHENYKNPISSFSNFAAWSELDINLKEDAILLNGFTFSDDYSNNYLNIFLKQSPRSMELDEILPANTSTFIALGISDNLQFKVDYLNFLERSGALADRTTEINKISAEFGVDVSAVILELLDREVALVFTDVNTNDLDENSYVVIQTKSQSLAMERMNEMLTTCAEKKGITIDAYKDEFQIDDETVLPVYKMPIKYFAAKLFGRLFAKAETNYFIFVENNLVFGNSGKSLAKYYHSVLLQKTLKSDIEYNDFADNLSSKYNFFFYTNVAYSPGLYAGFLTEELNEEMEKNLPVLQKISGLGIQFSSSKNMIYNNIFIKHNQSFKQRPHTVWESKLDNPLRTKPKLVVNHNNNSKEIFVQDIGNTVYLINSAGVILWKHHIEEEIVGSVYQVDYYNNNKLQYLFSTTSKMHILDRNGGYVERYPIRLVSPTKSGISLFDYENKKNYRIMVACNDKKIYTYAIDGNIVSGWEFDKTETFVRNKIQHFDYEDKDYICFADSLKIYILDRRGNARITPEIQFPSSKNNSFYFDDQPRKKERFIATDTSGTVMFISLDGSIQKMVFETFTSMHQFDYMDVDGDSKKDFIFLDGKNLKVFNWKKEKIIDKKYDNAIHEKPIFFLFPGNSVKIGIVSEKSNEIFLLNSNGSIYEGFPLEGMTSFSIGHISKTEQKFNLVVGSKDGFLYNYEVN